MPHLHARPKTKTGPGHARPSGDAVQHRTGVPNGRLHGAVRPLVGRRVDVHDAGGRAPVHRQVISIALVTWLIVFSVCMSLALEMKATDWLVFWKPT